MCMWNAPAETESTCACTKRTWGTMYCSAFPPPPQNQARVMMCRVPCSPQKEAHRESKAKGLM